MAKILLTGGGTAGHVTPNLALIPKLIKEGYQVVYVGSYKGIEKNLIEEADIIYKAISTGKLRRYFSLKNFTDIFRIIRGYYQAKRIIRKEKPDIVFSKGGFVAVPVVRAAYALKIPVIIHESDITVGLANRISIKYADKVCYNFKETEKYLPKEKAIYTGTPIREELTKGDKKVAKDILGFEKELPVILVIGGSLGANSINNTIRESLEELLKEFNVIHICGKEKVSKELINIEGYKQFEYVKNELKDFFVLADIVISRAGANSLCELLFLKKPNILIPLSAKVSRGDQILNARSFKELGYSEVLDEDELSKEKLIEKVQEVYKDKEKYYKKMAESEVSESADIIMKLIEKTKKLEYN